MVTFEPQLKEIEGLEPTPPKVLVNPGPLAFIEGYIDVEKEKAPNCIAAVGRLFPSNRKALADLCYLSK